MCRADGQYSVAEIEVEPRLRRNLIDNLRVVSTVTATLMHFFLDASVPLLPSPVPRLVRQSTRLRIPQSLSSFQQKCQFTTNCQLVSSRGGAPSTETTLMSINAPSNVCVILDYTCCASSPLRLLIGLSVVGPTTRVFYYFTYLLALGGFCWDLGLGYF